MGHDRAGARRRPCGRACGRHEDGVRPAGKCGGGHMGVGGGSGDGVGMTEHRAITPSATQLTGADHDALRRELDALRSRHRVELERGLRDARMFGSPADGDEILAVVEEAAVSEARIARLETLLRSASIVDGAGAFDGRAVLGCTVRVAQDDGREIDYLLVGRRHPGSGPGDVSIASPVGTALIGARPGEIVEVALPDGRRRSLVVLDVRMAAADARAA
jgi:transcription elongation factor GreA